MRVRHQQKAFFFARRVLRVPIRLSIELRQAARTQHFALIVRIADINQSLLHRLVNHRVFAERGVRRRGAGLDLHFKAAHIVFLKLGGLPEPMLAENRFDLFDRHVVPRHTRHLGGPLDVAVLPPLKERAPSRLPALNQQLQRIPGRDPRGRLALEHVEHAGEFFKVRVDLLEPLHHAGGDVLPRQALGLRRRVRQQLHHLQHGARLSRKAFDIGAVGDDPNGIRHPHRNELNEGFELVALFLLGGQIVGHALAERRAGHGIHDEVRGRQKRLPLQIPTRQFFLFQQDAAGRHAVEPIRKVVIREAHVPFFDRAELAHRVRRGDAERLPGGGIGKRRTVKLTKRVGAPRFDLLSFVPIAVREIREGAAFLPQEIVLIVPLGHAVVEEHFERGGDFGADLAGLKRLLFRRALIGHGIAHIRRFALRALPGFERRRERNVIAGIALIIGDGEL